MTQYAIDEERAAKLFWRGIIADLILHEVLIPEDFDNEYLARGVLEFAALATATFGKDLTDNPHVMAAHRVIQSRCQHDWDYDPWEYGGADCKICGYRDHNDKGLR